MTEMDISNKNCTIEKEGHVMIVTLNRPEARNALSPTMLIGMYRAWRLLDEDSDLYCAVLTGKGDTFCAGMDLRAAQEGSDDAKEIQDLMMKIPNLHWQALLRDNRPVKPVILAVEGYALGGGTEILLGSDIRVSAEDALFGLPEVTHALYAMGGGTVRLPRQIPYCLAAECLLLGRHFSAAQALEWGLINHIVPKAKAFEEAMKLAEHLCQNGPLAIKAITRSLREHQTSMPEEEAMLKSDEIASAVFASEDAKEGMKAFKEKRKPNYQGR